MAMISSFTIGKCMHKIGEREPVIIFGSFLIIIEMMMLAGLHYVEGARGFFALAVCAQILGGIGSGAFSTAGFAIISSFEGVEREKYIG